MTNEEREGFEAKWPIPAYCERCGENYVATNFNAWDAYKYINRWEGWKARAALASRPAELPIELHAVGLSDEQILHRWDTHVGDPTVERPIIDTDKINFARAIEFDVFSAAFRQPESETEAKLLQRPIKGPAIDKFNEGWDIDRDGNDPIERLRFFCSFALAGQDWLDVEPFFDALPGQTKDDQ